MSIEKIKLRNEAMRPAWDCAIGVEGNKYLENKYGSKGNSIVMRSHRDPLLDVTKYTNRTHYEDILMHENDIIYDKKIIGRILELFATSRTLVQNKDVDGEDMFYNEHRTLTEENVLYYQLVAVGFVLLPDNKFLFLRNNEKHNRLPNLTTMVQGHVETSYYISTMSNKQYMEYQLCRELIEEVEIKLDDKEIDVFTLMKYTDMKKIVYTMIDEVTREHVGALSIVDLRELEGEVLKFKSKEDSHDVLVGTIEDIIKSGEMDIWSSIVIDAITNGDIQMKTNIKGGK